MVGERECEQLAIDALLQARIQDGEDDFDPGAQVAIHPVGTAEPDFLVAAVGKVKDAAVL